MENRSMPPGTIIPELVYPDLAAAADWLCTVLGFSKRLQIGDHRMQMVLNRVSLIAVGGQPGVLAQRADHSIMLRVPDVDAHYAHARQAGVAILNPPASYPYGERQYTLRDPGGHIWTISQSIRDVDPRDWGGTPFDPQL